MSEYEPMTINAGADIGNGFCKILIAGNDTTDQVDMPSSVAVLTRPNQLPTSDAEAVALLCDENKEWDFYNELDVRISSPLVPDMHRHIFGTRSLSAGGALDEFDTIGRASKAKQPLSKVIVLGTFAAKALRDYVQANASLPDQELEVTASVALALPINEYLRHREGYAAEFLHSGFAHRVIIENFETKVSVRITFVDVQVLAEGASAQYAINAHGVPIMEAMLTDVRSRLEPGSEQAQELDLIEAADVLAATDTIGIDLGSGTCNLTVFSSGRFNVEASATFDKGYGSVLEAAMKAMDDQGIDAGFSSRNELATFLASEPKPLKRKLHARVKQFVDTEVEFYVGELVEKFGSVLRNVGARTEVAFVFGGGSGPVRDVLHPALLAKVAEMNSIGGFPVLYLDAGYSRHLNREGLFIAVEAMAARAAQNRTAGSARQAATKKKAS